MIKKIGLATFLLIIILVISSWDIIVYGIKQAKGQLSITYNTAPITQVLADPTVSDSVKWKINIVQQARNFAFDSLGLKVSDNYTTFYDQKGRVALWNLSASRPYALEPNLWSFPLLGSFPYKGFFDLSNAREEMNELVEKGYDARIRPISGWSTLGWTSDPILSNMLERPEGSLAELIIHELTHSTLFVKDNIEFNENLASFIGEKGAIKFLNNKYGNNSEAYFEYILAEEDGRTFRNQMLLGTASLDSLYESIADEPDTIKAGLKTRMINQITRSIDTLHFHNPRYYEIFENSSPNNAFFMSYLRYYSAKDSLEELLSNKYQNDLRLFVDGMKSFHR